MTDQWRWKTIGKWLAYGTDEVGHGFTLAEVMERSTRTDAVGSRAKQGLAELHDFVEVHQDCQAKLDARAADLARLTQSTVTRTKQLEASVRDLERLARVRTAERDEAREALNLRHDLEGLVHVEEPYRAKHLVRTVSAQVDTEGLADDGVVDAEIEDDDEERREVMTGLADAFTNRAFESLLRGEPEIARRLSHFADVAAEQAGMFDDDEPVSLKSGVRTREQQAELKRRFIGLDRQEEAGS